MSEKKLTVINWGACDITVFDNFLGGETVIYVNFARYSVIEPRDGDKNP